MASSPHKPRGPRPPHVPEERPGQVGGTRDKNRRRRIRDLCDAGLELFLERGINPVTIDELARAGGLSKASFYRYFRDKTELVDTVLREVREAALAAFDTCEAALARALEPEELLPAYQALGAALGALLLSHRREILLYLQESRAPDLGARHPVCALGAEIDSRALRLTEAARTHGLLRPFDPRVSSLAVVGAAERLLLSVMRGDDLGDVKALPTALASLVLDGMRS